MVNTTLGGNVLFPRHYSPAVAAAVGTGCAAGATGPRPPARCGNPPQVFLLLRWLCQRERCLAQEGLDEVSEDGPEALGPICPMVGVE